MEDTERPCSSLHAISFTTRGAVQKVLVGQDHCARSKELCLLGTFCLPQFGGSELEKRKAALQTLLIQLKEEEAQWSVLESECAEGPTDADASDGADPTPQLPETVFVEVQNLQKVASQVISQDLHRLCVAFQHKGCAGTLRIIECKYV